MVKLSFAKILEHLTLFPHKSFRYCVGYSNTNVDLWHCWWMFSSSPAVSFKSNKKRYTSTLLCTI